MSRGRASPPRAADGAADAVYELRYERYQGPRRERGTRFWIIARTLVRQAWKSTWGVKLPLALAAMVVVGASVAMWVLRHEVVEMARQAAGARGVPIPVPGVEAALYMSVAVFAFLAFVLTTVVGCRAIADDLRLGSFQFYFSRPLRVLDYVTGKLTGVAIVIGLPMLAGPVLLALVRLLLAKSPADAWAHVDVIPRAMAVGVVGTVSYAVVGMAIGALARRAAWAQAGFAIYYVVIATLIETAAHKTGQPWLALLSIDANLTSVGVALFDSPLPPETTLPPALAAAAATTALVAAGFWVIAWRVRGAETAALGGPT